MRTASILDFATYKAIIAKKASESAKEEMMPSEKNLYDGSARCKAVLHSAEAQHEYDLAEHMILHTTVNSDDAISILKFIIKKGTSGLRAT